tara:strand:+ start:205 stop:984 length:780 start_codon:yes stop_codon:yes gene_type:complete
MIEQPEEEEEAEKQGGGWLITYADLMTLLFASFVVLYGTSKKGESNDIYGMAATIREAFVEIPDEIEEVARFRELNKGKIQFREAKRDSTIPSNIKKFNRSESVIADKDQSRSRIDALLDKYSQGDGLHYSLRKATAAAQDEYGIRLKLLNSAYFKKGTNQLTDEGRKEVLKIGNEIKKLKKEVFIEGHTDSKSDSSGATLLETSAIRAGIIKRLWENKLGINSSLLKTSAYGSFRPAASNSSANGRRLNNRVEIKIRY